MALEGQEEEAEGIQAAHTAHREIIQAVVQILEAEAGVLAGMSITMMVILGHNPPHLAARVFVSFDGDIKKD